MAATCVGAAIVIWWLARLGPIPDRFPDREPLRDLSTAGASGRHVMLVFHNQRIQDRQLARIITFVSTAIPVERWQQVAVPPRTTVWKVADDYYDLYHRGYGAQPMSADALIGALRRGNPGLLSVVATGDPLRMPPVPVRAMTRYPRQRVREDFRVYSAGMNAYQRIVGGDTFRLPVRQQTTRLAELLDPFRGTAATGILLEVTPELLDAVRRLDVPALLVNADPEPSRNGAVETSARLEMLAGTEGCTDGFAELKASPYYQEKALAGIPAATRKRMIELAKKKRLVILDTQTRLPFGHGQKVYNVVRAVLDTLGGLDFEPMVDRFDLLPASGDATESLTKALDAYLAIKPPIPDSLFTEARAWLTEKRKDAEQLEWPLTFFVPEALLQATLRQHFIVGADETGPSINRSAAWLNMSFRVRSSALSVVMNRFRRGDAIAFVAAGNDAGEPVPFGFVPQDGATDSDQFVLVTHGSPTRIDGSISMEGADGPPVSLVAPGCGFGGMTEGGSSFASPYVAVVAWLRYLREMAEGRPADTAAIVRELVFASHPVAGFTRIRSNGFFDAAQFMASSGVGQLRTKTGVVTLRAYSIEGACDVASGTPPRFSFKWEAPPMDTSISSFFLVDKDGKPELWRRRVAREDKLQATTKPVCVVREMSVTTTPETGTPRTFTLKQFADDVRVLTGPSQ